MFSFQEWKLRMYIVALLAGVLASLDARAVPPAPALPPVLLVHGMSSTGRDMERLARHLRSLGREVHVPTLTPNRGQAPLDDLARQLAQYAAREFHGRHFDIVGFSMGGLVARYYLQRLGGLDSVNHFVTLAAPHHGTRMARLGKLPGWVQMRPGSEFLGDLASDADSLRRVKFTSIYTPLDTIIVPARSSEMPQARNIRIWAAMHPSLILEKRCIRTVADALR